MKKVLQLLGVSAALIASTDANAQIPDNGVIPAGLEFVSYQPVAGYTGNHIYDMGTWDVDSILDSGSSIILDLFGTWCPPCWTYHEGHELNNVYDAMGWGGTGDVAIFAIDASTSANNFEFITNANNGQGDWINDTKYPMVDNSSMGSVFNVTGFPTMVAICPDRTVTEITRTSPTATNYSTVLGACGTTATSANDPRILSHNTTTAITVCGGAAPSTEIKVVVQNFSTASINGTYNIEASIGGSVVASTSANLNLAAYDATEVNLGVANLSVGTNNVDVSITTANDDLANDDISISIVVEEAADLGIGDIILDIEFDGYGSEVGYGLASGTVQETDPFAAYPDFSGGSYPGQIDFYSIGEWADGDAGFSKAYPGLTAGCYHLYMFDNYGDGLTFPSNGAVTLSSPNSSLTSSMDVAYGSGSWTTFEVSTDGTGGFAGIEEAEEVEFAKVFPNPAVDMTNVQFNLTEAANVTVEVFNVYGQIVFSDNMGEVNGMQNVEVSTANLESGMYIVNINVNGNILSKRVSVVK